MPGKSHTFYSHHNHHRQQCDSKSHSFMQSHCLVQHVVEAKECIYIFILCYKTYRYRKSLKPRTHTGQLCLVQKSAFSAAHELAMWNGCFKTQGGCARHSACFGDVVYAIAAWATSPGQGGAHPSDTRSMCRTRNGRPARRVANINA